MSKKQHPSTPEQFDRRHKSRLALVEPEVTQVQVQILYLWLLLAEVVIVICRGSFFWKKEKEERMNRAIARIALWFVCDLRSRRVSRVPFTDCND
jgi:hypothetical protein